MVNDDGTRTKLPGKVAPQELRPNQRLVVESPGAGGYGPTSERDLAALEEDRASEKCTDEYLQLHYGL